MKSILCILLFTGLSLMSMSQNNIDTVFAKHIVKIYPLNYFAGREINLAYEYVINNHTSVEIIGAWNFQDWVFVPHFLATGKTTTSVDFFPIFKYLGEGGQLRVEPSIGGSIRLNYRFYFNNRKRPIPLGPFLNAQFMYKQTLFDALYYQCDGHDDSLSLNKQALTCKVLLGYQARMLKKVSLGYYIGLGIRYQIIDATRFYSIRYDDYEHEMIENRDKRTQLSQIVTPTIHLGISIGYYF